MDNNERKYPLSLFVSGFFMNMIKNFYLLLPGLGFAIAGIWIKWCLAIGVVLILADVVVSFAEQVRIRNAVLHSDNPEFEEWQDAILSTNWKDNVKSMVEDKIEENQE